MGNKQFKKSRSSIGFPSDEKQNPGIGFSVTNSPAQVIGLTESGESSSTKPKVFTVSKCQVLNLRSGPSKDSHILESLPVGTRLTVTVDEDGWSFVQGYDDNKIIGYVMSTYLTAESE